MIRAETQILLNELMKLLGEKVELTFNYPIDPDFARFKTGLAEDALVRSAGGLVEKLVAIRDPELAGTLLQQLNAGHFRYNVRPIVRLLDETSGADAQKALRICLTLPDLDGVAAAVRALGKSFVAEDLPLLVSLVRHSDRSVRIAAVVAAAKLRSPELAEAVASCLNSSSAEERMQAAITLGHQRATEFAARIAEGLGEQRDSTFAAYVAALELLGDRGVVPKLISLLQQADKAKVWDLTHALWVLTGVAPYASADRRAESVENLRRAWLTASAAGHLSSPPRASVIRQVRLGSALVGFDLAFGRSTICLDVDPPTPGATWPRWGRSLRVAGRSVYNIGSTCGTCESLLRLIGWPNAEVSAVAQQLESSAPGELTADWLSAWAPLIEQFRSGRYLAGLISMQLERVDRDHSERSWFFKRRKLRVTEPEDDDLEEESPSNDWPGTAHYQGPYERGTYPVLMPLHDVTQLDESRVERFARSIAAGERPAAVAMGWVDDREVQGNWPERFFNIIILNGHHRLEAYARTGFPAPIAVIARVDDSWGPPEEPERYLRESFSAFSPKQ